MTTVSLRQSVCVFILLLYGIAQSVCQTGVPSSGEKYSDTHKISRSEAAFVEWAGKNQIRLKSTDSQSNDLDIAPVSRMVGDARIVALGEATHGTHEFFLAKQRLIQEFAHSQKHIVLAIEANMPEAALVNRYVLYGEGDPKLLLRGMYCWCFQNEEMLALVNWMRSVNQSGEAHIEFAGFDMQNTSLAISEVREFANHSNPELAAEIENAYSRVQEIQSKHQATSNEELSAILVACLKIEDTLKLSPTPNINPDRAWATQMAHIITQNIWMRMDKVSRDESMAENVRWLAETDPHARLIVWAHNGHVTYDGDSYRSMGSILRTYYGNKLFTFGFAFDRGSFNAVNDSNRVTVFTVGPALAGSMDDALARVDSSTFILNLKRLPKSGPVFEWANAEHAARNIGGPFKGDEDPSSTVMVPVAKRFDAMVFVGNTSATTQFPRK